MYLPNQFIHTENCAIILCSTIYYSFSPMTLQVSLDKLDNKAQAVEWFEVQPEFIAEPPLAVVFP